MLDASQPTSHHFLGYSFVKLNSGTMILAMLLVLTPFIFPAVMRALPLMTGMVQAYIFSILPTVYIAAATSDVEDGERGDCGR